MKIKVTENELVMTLLVALACPLLIPFLDMRGEECTYQSKQ